ncbi:MAG: MarR family transcriptional regulator [Blastopirellula sp.]|nr:MAG: MarR family transcriptional regulator [Blastopirellula sp.]
MEKKNSSKNPNKAAQTRPGKMKSRLYKDLWRRPGYLIRRLHQIHVGLFLEECADKELTPIQFGILSVLYNGEEMDQLTLSSSVGIDRTSGADVIKRLERRNLLYRTTSELDKRAKIITITQQGKDFVDKFRPSMARAQERLVEPLDEQEREQFFILVGKMLEANDAASRAPLS